MTELVHYLIRHPTNGTGLIYPSDVDDATYVGFGAFYFLGLPGSRVAESYRFYAIQGEETIQIPLRPFRRSRSFFRAEVPAVGAFVFYAQPIARKPAYIGSSDSASNLSALRRLRSWQPHDLDRACREHQFYFVGYSPRLGVAASQR